MPKIILTKEARLADRIIRCLPSNNELAKINGISKQAQSYRTRKMYPLLIPEIVRVLESAGYEIKEK